HRITNHILGNWLLIESLSIHENIIVTINIEKLPVLMFNAHVIYSLTCAKSLLYYTTSSQILQIDAHKRTPVSRANMMKFCYSIEVVIIAYYHAVVKIGCCCCTQWRFLISFNQ